MPGSSTAPVAAMSPGTAPFIWRGSCPSVPWWKPLGRTRTAGRNGNCFKNKMINILSQAPTALPK